MEYFNLMELLVRDTVDEILGKDESLKSIKFQRNDIIAYVLNRIAPRYVTSERGIIHSRIDTRLKLQEQTDILFLTYESIELFLKRRESEPGQTAQSEAKTSLLPYLIGEVLDEATLAAIPDLSVTLLYNNRPAALMDDGWKNPYTTTCATRGYYHFWPEYDEKNMSGKETIEFQIRFSHDKFEERTVNLCVRSNRHSESGKAVSVPLVLLKLKAGVNTDFLCS